MKKFISLAIAAATFTMSCVMNTATQQNEAIGNSVNKLIDLRDDCGDHFKTGVMEATLGTNCSKVAMDQQTVDYGFGFYTAAEQSLFFCNEEIKWHWSEANSIVRRAYEFALRRDPTDEERERAFKLDGYSHAGCTRPGGFMNTIMRIQRETKHTAYFDYLRSCRQENEAEKFECLMNFSKSVNAAMFSTYDNCGYEQCVEPAGSVSIFDMEEQGLGTEYMDTRTVPAYCLIVGKDTCNDGFMKELLIGRYVFLRRIREEYKTEFLPLTGPFYRRLQDSFFTLVKHGVEKAGGDMTKQKYEMYADFFFQDYPYRLWTSDLIADYEKKMNQPAPTPIMRKFMKKNFVK